ncbi:MAG: metallophosphoesterase [Candidatus Thorarchaeota archaeon]|jgi:predicted phosphodiesterase
MLLAKQVLKGKTDLTSEEIEQLVGTLSDQYKNLPNVVETQRRNVFYVGDLHGELQSAKAAQELLQNNRDSSIVFLGDYADRGPQQVETVNLVFSLAIEYPSRVLALRGNHESDSIARTYGFYNAVKARYSPYIFDVYCSGFKILPLAGLSSNGVFSCHGGIPEGVETLEQIQEVDRFHENFPDPIAFQLTWNDPSDGDFRFSPNWRGGGSRVFGRLAFNEFMESLGLTLMFRAHQVFPDGVKTFFDGKLISIFSSAYSNRVKPKIAFLRDGLKTELMQI